MVQLVLLDHFTCLSFTIERDNTQLRRPALELADPVRNCRVWYDNQGWESVEIRHKMANQRDDLDCFALKSVAWSHQCERGNEIRTRPISSARMQF